MKISLILALSALVASAGTPHTYGTVPTTKRPVPAVQRDFSAIVHRAVKEDMPTNGGYGASGTASKNLRSAIAWSEKDNQLNITPATAKPAFCSGACYLALVQSLKNWEKQSTVKLTPEAWKKLAVTPQADGVGIWGRANANGPGFAKLVYDLKAGINFTDIQAAKPGDFLKFFWNKEIGCKERGHIVIFLSYTEEKGVKYITYWSANKPDGYSIRKMALSKMHHLIFTRITNPQNFNNITALPKEDPWLKDMLKKSFSFEDVRSEIGISNTPTKATKKTKSK